MAEVKNSHTFHVSPERLAAFASKVQRWAKREASRQHDLVNFEVDPYDLTGMCAIAAAKAHYWLHRAGVGDVRIALSSRWIEGHAYLIVGGYRVDPTAMQFGLANSLVQLHTQTKNPWYYKKPKLFDSVEAFSAYLDSISWSEKQHPRCIENRTLMGEDGPPKIPDYALREPCPITVAQPEPHRLRDAWRLLLDTA